jgi:hypothetical protein
MLTSHGCDVQFKSAVAKPRHLLLKRLIMKAKIQYGLNNGSFTVQLLVVKKRQTGCYA